MADTELVKAQDNSLMAARPSFLPMSSEGTEHITQEDVRLPKLAIAQGLSDQLKRQHAKFIPGLSIGQMFNDLTGHIYGTDPIEFFIVRADPPRWVQFKPRNEGGGVIDPDVPPGDPRTQWTTNSETGERVKPIATMFYDYVLCLWPSRELIVLSMKSSGIKHAKSLNGLIKLRNAPLWSGKYIVSVADEPSPQGPFPNWNIKIAGEGIAGWVSNEEDARFLKGLFDNFKTKTIIIEREPGDEDDHHEGGQPTAAGVAGAPGENIPF